VVYPYQHHIGDARSAQLLEVIRIIGRRENQVLVAYPVRQVLRGFSRRLAQKTTARIEVSAAAGASDKILDRAKSDL
jgi:hypothetical protein